MGQSCCPDISVTTYQPTTRNVAELLRFSKKSFGNILFITQKKPTLRKKFVRLPNFYLVLKKNWAFFISPMHETGNIKKINRKLITK